MAVADFSEEWELDVADDSGGNFHNGSEDEQWISSGRAEYSAVDANPKIRSGQHDWRRQRETLSPLEGAQLEAEMQDETNSASTDSRHEETPNDGQMGDRSNVSTGGDQFQAMDDGYGNGETYYYDEDLTRAGERGNADMRDRTHSDADLILRSSRFDSRSRINTLFPYIIVAVVALGVGILLGVLIDMATYACPNQYNEETTKTPSSSDTSGNAPNRALLW